MEKHIGPGSTLVHDGENSHSALIEKLNLASEIHKTEETKKLEDKENPLDPVNDLHSLIKRYIREHGGFRREDLQDWMNLAWFVLHGEDAVYLRVRDFLRKAVSEQHLLRYRDYYGKKGKKNGRLP
jgi:hypothetical protein